MTKKFLVVLLLGIIMVNTSPITTHAAETTMVGLGISENADSVISPNVEPACPYGVNHQMKSNGFGTAYYGAYPDTSNYLCGDCLWQCQNCYLLMVTNGEAPLGEPIGTYATYNPGEAVGSYVTIWTTTYGYTSSSTLSGYHFYYVSR